jgi:serine-type D-Ala-D-Ala carboxypeptidase/endopeptidase (penicillin-binding protein 4)
MWKSSIAAGPERKFHSLRSLRSRAVQARAKLAGGIAAVALVAIPAAPATADEAASAVPGEGGTTPVARPGTELAARGSLSKSQLRRQLEREMDRVGGGSGAWVADVRGGSRGVLYSDSGKRRRLLASNSKLFATAAFLDRFGAKGKLETGVWERGGRGGRNDQIVRGGLVLVGDGDPALGSPGFARGHNVPLTRLRPLARKVRRAGIRRVKGNLMVDPTIFDGKRSVPQPGISGGPFLSTLSGLSYNSGFDHGRYADSPERLAGRAFERHLRKVGVKVAGRVRVGGAPGNVLRDDPLGVARSPSAATLIEQTNTPSDNFFAEMLLKRVAARGGRKGTTARGAAKAEKFAKRAGSGAKLVNGSGLSRRNASSPREVGKLLLHMAREDALDRAFRNSLAVAGRTGTLSGRMRGTAAEGRCRGKTGTIDGVSALSGYCKTGAGLVAFSILMNGVNVDAARNAQDAMAAAIARYDG